LALAPNLAEAWLGRGLALNALGRYPEALSAFDRAAPLAANRIEVHIGHGVAFHGLNRHQEALAAYKRALTLKPDLSEILADCGRIYIQLRQFEKAPAAYDRVLALKEDIKYAKGDRLYVKLQLSDWTNLDAEISDVIASVRADQTPTAPFEFLVVSSSPEDQLQTTKWCIADLTSVPAIWRGERYAHERVRVGYFSADFRNHPVAQLTVGLFEAHDKSRFETIALSLGPDDGSDLRRRIKSAFEDFVDVRNLSDADLAALIRRREVDILVDLTGFTHGGRFGVLARRDAPIQVNFPGYPGTMGADWIEYIIRIPRSFLRSISVSIASAWCGSLTAIRPMTTRISSPNVCLVAANVVCPRPASCFTASTIATRSTRTYSTSGCGSWPKLQTAFSGCLGRILRQRKICAARPSGAGLQRID
jgi:protein O-GlcNAc transferase